MDPLEAAKQRINVGDGRGAARELMEILRAEPQNVSAWLLLATLLEDPQKQADCYQRVLRLEPQHRQAMDQLRILRDPPVSEPGRSDEVSGEISPENEASSYTEHSDIYNEPEDRVASSDFDFGEEDAQSLSPGDELALVDYVVEALGDHVRPRNLIFEVCHRSGMSWQDAEAFVARVSAEHQHQIAKSKSPLSLFLGIGTILAGIAVTYAGGVVLIDAWQYLSTLDDLLFLNSIIRHYPYYFRGIAVIFVGLSMMLGGTAGVVATMRALKRGDETKT